MPANLSGPMFETRHYGRFFTTFVTATSKQHAASLLKELLPDYTFDYVGRTTLGEFISLDKAFHSPSIPRVLFRSDSGLIFQTAADTTDFYDNEQLDDIINNPEPPESEERH